MSTRESNTLKEVFASERRVTRFSSTRERFCEKQRYVVEHDYHVKVVVDTSFGGVKVVVYVTAIVVRMFLV